MLFIWIYNRKNWPFIIWFLLSIGMIIVPSFFWVNDFIDHPQHEEFDCYGAISEIIKNPEYVLNNFWYKVFFIIDFFWAFLSLALIGKFINDNTLTANGNRKKEPTHIWELFKFKKLSKTLKFYVIIAALSYLFDVAEGWLYFNFQNTLLKEIVSLKKIGYAICILYLIYYLFKNLIYPNLRAFLRFFWTSSFSIIFILFIYILLIFMPQGGTIVVHLFYSPSNIILFFFLLMFLAILLSHYPVYLDIWTFDKKKNIRLLMTEKPRFLGFGTIYYDTSKAVEEDYNDEVSKGLRRSLGIFLYVAVFAIMYSVIARFYEVKLNPFVSVLFVLAIALFIYYLEGRTYKVWIQNLTDIGISKTRLNRNIGYVVNYVKWFPWYFLLTILLTLVTALIVNSNEWSRISVIFFMITLGVQTFLYVMFKISRSFLKYVYFNENLYSNKPEVFNKILYNRFYKFFNDNKDKRPSSFFNFFAHLSDNVMYVRLMQLTGFISLFVIILTNLNVEIASFFNPIVVILFYIILIYSFLVIIFKHILFYSRSDSTIRYNTFFKYALPVSILLIIGLTQYLANKPSDLHELKKVHRNKELMAHEYFKNAIDTSNTNQNYFFVGSYGGGLKANLWNLIVFNELEQKSKQKFFEKTLVLSGVSGGAVGIGNYISLINNYSNQPDSVNQKIIEIGNSNVLSNELVLLLGKDWLREYLPGNLYNGRDRSFHSMQIHAKNTGMNISSENDTEYNTGFEDYWLEVYNKRHRKFPIIVMNSTSVGGVHGVASSVKFPSETFDGAVLMNQFTNKDSTCTLKFYDAVSTTNRFPFLSPTAKIEGKGSFIDGGYFENSGLLSAYQVYKFLKNDKTKAYTKIQPDFINIINSKDYYIKEKLNEYNVHKTFKEDPSEYQSILETIISTEKLPNHIFNKLKSENLEPIRIMMPHKLTYKGVKSLSRGEVENPLRLMDSIRANNDSIDSALRRFTKYDLKKWGVVEPPLARLLSEPAVYYQMAMVKEHYAVKKEIEEVSKIAQKK